MRNIVLLSFDSVRADHCSYLGYDRKTTPYLDVMANEGMSYSNAISPASRTNPSMSGIMTGEPMYYRGDVSNPQHSRSHLSRHGTIAEDLSSAGYSTGAFCPNAYASRYYGFDKGFDMFEDFLFTNDRYQNLWEKHVDDSGIFTTLRNIRNFIRREEAFRTWDTYVDDAISWANEQSEPFFLWMFSLDPHYPYLTPRSHRKYSNLFEQYYYNWICYRYLSEFDVEIAEKTKKKMIDIYDDSIRYGDILIEVLKQRLSEFDPIFIIHSDHGEAFGERGMYGHSFPYLYDENVRVPLVISGVDSTKDITEPVSLLQLRNVMSSLSEGKVPDFGSTPALSTEYDGRNERSVTAVRSEQHKYIINRTLDNVDQELYNVNDDTSESQNIINNPGDADGIIDYGLKCVNQEQEVLQIREAVSGLEGV